MKCIHCDSEVEDGDNFCWKCGHWTTKGYKYLQNKDNVNRLYNGEVVNQKARFALLIILLLIGIVSFVVMNYTRGNDLYRPLAYLKKQVNSYKYGYSSTLIKTENKYSKQNINSYESAINFIKKDFDDQEYLCNHNLDVSTIEYELEDKYKIPSVSLCDVSLDEAKKIKEVISSTYELFPNVIGGLTNITVANAKTTSEYIARFQPMYQFVNINENINNYNKVNKTQILLNSYYFLNEDILSKGVTSVVKEDWYVKDATWESTISHELGHYISFMAFLKENQLENITYITSSNNYKINELLKEYDSGNYSKKIVDEALNNYNIKNNTNLNIDEFCLTISNYADAKDDDGKLIADETIAEAIHDYYLHGEDMQKSSNEIVNIIKEKLR